MQVNVVLPIFALVAVVAVVGIPLPVPDYVVCPEVDDVGAIATLFPNVYNCSTYYMCEQGVPTLRDCTPNLAFNGQVCDFKYKVDCKELPITTEAPATTEAPVTTEAPKAQEKKIIITKVVTEIIK
uniref:Putative tick mucins 1 n=1 Tax=Amblyomma triste TaxID=251400 RepID=A0A023G9J1_AMBTT